MFKNWSGNEKNDNRVSSLSGYLWKMKRERKMLVSQWDKRYFCIEGTRLKWYLNKDADEPHGILDLQRITGACPFEGGNGVFSFVIRNPDRNLLLRAATANERDMWIRAVASQADRARGGKGTSIIFDPRLTHIANGMSGSTKGGVSLERKLEEAIRQLDRLDDNVRCEDSSKSEVSSNVGNGISSNPYMGALARQRAENARQNGSGRRQDESSNHDDHSNNYASQFHEFISAPNPRQSPKGSRESSRRNSNSKNNSGRKGEMVLDDRK